MIIEFKMKNFRSYKNEAVFSFEALPEETLEDNVATIHLKNGSTIRLLRSAGIFGPNASGKSNVIWALHGLSYVVDRSLSFTRRSGIPIYYPYLLNSQDSKKCTTMTYKSVINGVVYIYEVEFNAHFFVKETLWLWESRDENCVYSVRLELDEKKRLLNYGPLWKDSKDGLKEDVDEFLFGNQLLLSKLGTMASCSFVDFYEDIVYMEIEPSGDFLSAQQHNRMAADFNSSKEEEVFNRVKRLLQIADVGIIDIKRKEKETKKTKSIDYEDDDKQFEYFHIHKGENGYATQFPNYLESTGTNKLFEIGSRTLLALELGLNVAYDEIDMAIHPNLFRLIISLFNNPKCNPHNAQILFTCHTPSVCEDLRADQIWFAQKNKEGVSELYSVQDFEGAKIRMPFESLYKSGRFGAKPDLGDISKIYGF